MFTDGYENHSSDTLTGAVGGAMGDVQSPNPATRAKAATKKTSF